MQQAVLLVTLGMPLLSLMEGTERQWVIMLSILYDIRYNVLTVLCSCYIFNLFQEQIKFGFVHSSSLFLIFGPGISYMYRMQMTSFLSLILPLITPFRAVVQGLMTLWLGWPFRVLTSRPSHQSSGGLCVFI